MKNVGKMKLKCGTNLALTVSQSLILRLILLTVAVFAVEIGAKPFHGSNGPQKQQHHHHQHPDQHSSHNYVSLKPFENSKLSSSSLLLAVNSKNSGEPKSKHHPPQHQHPRKPGYLREKRRTTTTSISTGAFHSASLISADIKNKIMGTLAKNDSGCPTNADRHCLKCNIDGCVKCPTLLVYDTRQCVEFCPSGYMEQWSSHPEFMGKICVSTGLSGPIIAAIVGLLAGFLVCFSLLFCAVYVIRRKKRRKTVKEKLINENTIDRSDFLQQLNEMRPNAEYFLSMLNDARRQIRKLYLAGDPNTANSYRPLVRDLAKILILLNRPIELIPSPPSDWGRIYAWSDQALDKYKPKVGQLIDIFQTTTTTLDEVNEDESPQKKSLIKTRSAPPANSKFQLFGSLISLHEFEEPRPSDPFGNSFNTFKSNLITDLNTSSLWLEDEFFKLGFRPQDEITTEL